MTLAIQLVTLLIPVVAFFYIGRTLLQVWRDRQRMHASDQEWAHIQQMAQSNDPEQKREAVRLYLEKLQRGPYG